MLSNFQAQHVASNKSNKSMGVIWTEYNIRSSFHQYLPEPICWMVHVGIHRPVSRGYIEKCPSKKGEFVMNISQNSLFYIVDVFRVVVTGERWPVLLPAYTDYIGNRILSNYVQTRIVRSHYKDSGLYGCRHEPISIMEGIVVFERCSCALGTALHHPIYSISCKIPHEYTQYSLSLHLKFIESPSPYGCFRK